MMFFRKKKKAVKLTEKNSWEAEATCMNCGHHQHFKVPKGKGAMAYSSEVKCDDCANSNWRVTVY